jgi:hypothetical protein
VTAREEPGYFDVDTASKQLPYEPGPPSYGALTR